MNSVKIGTFTGNAAAQNISIGFIPDSVEVFNITDGDSAWYWQTGMTAAHALYEDSLGARSRITANGISTYAGSSSASPGFTIGTALSEDTKLFGYRAMRNFGGL